MRCTIEFGCRCCLKDGALGLEEAANLHGVDQIAVMRSACALLDCTMMGWALSKQKNNKKKAAGSSECGRSQRAAIGREVSVEDVSDQAHGAVGIELKPLK